jgi:hypothetical protein
MKTPEISKIAQELIISNKLQEVFEILISFAKNDKDSNDYLNDILLLSSRYNQIKKQSISGLLSYAEESLEKNKIVHSLLEIVSNLDEKTNNVEIQGNNNITIQSISGSTINIDGNFKIEDEIAKADEKVIQKLIQSQSTIKILFLSANPLDTNPLRLDKEMREIENELIRSKFRERFEFIKISAVRISDFQDALLNHSPNFVHFSGHGNEIGIALLDNRTDNKQIVQTEPLANLLRMFSNDIACVFLNSCYSENQAKAIKRFIPNVIGMNNLISDDIAIEFAKVFYKAIGAGKEISFSFEFAKNSIDLQNIQGSNIPVIL